MVVVVDEVDVRTKEETAAGGGEGGGGRKARGEANKA